MYQRHQHNHYFLNNKSIIPLILSSLLVHRSEEGPSSEAKSYFFGNGGSLRKRGRGGGGRGSRGGRGGRGGEGGRRRGGLARQELLEHRVHLTADYVLREREEEKQTARERHTENNRIDNVASVTLITPDTPVNNGPVTCHL